MFASHKCRGISIIILDDVLKLWIELIKSRNDNTTGKFYRFRVVWKNTIFGRNFEIFEKSRNFEKIAEGGAPALRVIRAGTRLTVHRSLPWLVEWKYSSLSKRNTETVAKPGRLGPAQNDEPMQNFVELSRFHSMKCINTWRKPCQAYIENQHKCVKIWKT